MNFYGGDNDDCCGNNSTERALADIEIVRSAYPDETTSTQPCDESNATQSFPLNLTLYLSKSQKSYIILEWKHGYPTRTSLQISEYRDDSNHKQRMEETVQAVRATALECFNDGIEAGLDCCSTAFEIWNNYNGIGGKTQNDDCDEQPLIASTGCNPLLNFQPSEPSTTTTTATAYQWYTSDESNMIHDRKSIFVGHVCPICTESDVTAALQQLLQDNNKLQRATHHMYAYRLMEEKIVTDHNKTSVPSTTRTISVLKYDSNDDGEDGAGIRLSQLLQFRKEMNLLIVVSRWFGGIHLGSKRFAHIVAAAQTALIEYHDRNCH